MAISATASVAGRKSRVDGIPGVPRQPSVDIGVEITADPLRRRPEGRRDGGPSVGKGFQGVMKRHNFGGRSCADSW